MKHPMELDNKKILIVDDEKAIYMGLAMCIKTAGFEPLTADNGNDALRLVEKHRPVLVILDVMMNDLSGLEVCQILRKNPQLNGLKIIILSAKGQLREQEEGIKAGADYYITKPFDYKELINIIKQLLKT